MRILPGLLTLALAAAPIGTPVGAQATAPQLELLGKLTGHWLLRGIIAKKQTTHDMEIDWVLNKEYVQIRETSREKDAQGRPAYDAIVYLAWDAKAGEYVCLWLDNTAPSRFAPVGTGKANAANDQIAIVINDPGGSVIHNTLTYDRKADRWTMNIDNEDKGKITSFAKTTLTRK